MKYFETHAHYTDEIFDKNREEILRQCKETGIEYMVDVGYNLESSQKSICLTNQYDNMFSAIGVHPHDVKTNTAQDIYDLYITNKDQKIVAIGEIGLDYYFVSDNKKEQATLFIEQIELANTLKLPILIHSRDASLDTYQIVKEHRAEYGTLFHCFHPTEDLVRLVLERNYMVAFGGNITYKRNQKFAEYVNQILIKQIVLETDSPYLPPEPYRGTINTSLHLPIICKKLAELKGMEESSVANYTFENAKRFFKID